MDFVYVALYDLKCSHQHVLVFKKGDRFIPLSSKRNNPNWMFCVDILGTIGYIPHTYIKKEPIPKEQLTDFIDVVLETLEKDCSGTYSKQQRDVIQELTTWRTLLLSPLHSPDDAATANVRQPTAIGKDAVSANTVPPQQVDQKQPASAPKIAPVIEKEQRDLIKVGVSRTDVTTQTESPNGKSFTCAKCADSGDTGSHDPNDVVERKDAQTQCTDEACDRDVVAKGAKKIPLRRSVQTEEDDLATVNGLDSSSNFNSCCSQCSKATEVPVWLIPSLIENIRCSTQLSHCNSKVAIAVVLDTLSTALPSNLRLWEQLRTNLDSFEIIQEQTENVIYSEDRRKLLNIFRQLWFCKNDEQQRSWPVHEDEAVISSLLKDLNSILMDADPKMTREIVQQDEYEIVNLLVTYYQMETRRVLRLNMLHVFVTLCELDIDVVNQLLVSVLPMELARDMQCTFDDAEKLRYSAFVLTIIFSTGQKPPNAIYEFLNDQFLNFLFEKVETCLRNGDDVVGNHLLNVLLAFNLHFESIKHNHVFACLKDRCDARMLTEKLFHYVNREEDPVNILNKPESLNSALKFFVDFFSFPELAQLLYLNDIRVLLDIIVRQLTDYLPGEKKRLWYLQLAKNIVQHSNYDEHFHQKHGLQKCFGTIMSEEDPCQLEIALVNDILNSFPDWFTLESD